MRDCSWKMAQSPPSPTSSGTRSSRSTSLLCMAFEPGLRALLTQQDTTWRETDRFLATSYPTSFPSQPSTPLPPLTRVGPTILINRKDVLALSTIVQEIAILVRRRDRLCLDIHQQRCLFLILGACVVLKPVKIHALCFSLVFVCL